VSPLVRTEDLIDAMEVAQLLGLSHRNSVSTYQRRYRDMPRPVVDLGRNRSRLWLKTEIKEWVRKKARPQRDDVD
jgi:predicted DNA-binding transcriptional regulator AlpA